MKKFFMFTILTVILGIFTGTLFAVEKSKRTDGKNIVMTDEMTIFIKAVAIKESGDKPKPPKWDVNAVRIGHLQLSKDVVKDAIQYNPKLNYITWEACEKNRSYSVKIFCAYMMRYCPDAVEAYNFEKMARIWNGGPKGHTGEATIQYWKDVEKIMKSLK